MKIKTDLPKIIGWSDSLNWWHIHALIENGKIVKEQHRKSDGKKFCSSFFSFVMIL